MSWQVVEKPLFVKPVDQVRRCFKFLSQHLLGRPSLDPAALLYCSPSVFCPFYLLIFLYFVGSRFFHRWSRLFFLTRHLSKIVIDLWCFQKVIQFPLIFWLAVRHINYNIIRYQVSRFIYICVLDSHFLLSMTLFFALSSFQFVVVFMLFIATRIQRSIH